MSALQRCLGCCLPGGEHAAVKEMLYYVLFLILFTVTLLGQSTGREPYQFQDMARDRFTSDDVVWIDNKRYRFPEISDVEDMWDWLEQPFVESLHPYKEHRSGERLDVGNTYSMEPLHMYYRKVDIIGDVVMIQKRAQPEECTFVLNRGAAYNEYIKNQPATDSSSNTCYDTFSRADESTAAFGDSKEFRWSDDPQASINKALLDPSTRYGPGGFLQVIAMPPNGGNVTTFESRTRTMIQNLRDQDWLDAASAALFIDFTLFNANTQLFATVRIQFEFLKTGGVLTDVFYRVHKFLRYEDANGIFFAFLEAVFYVMVFGYVMGEVVELIEDRWKYFQSFWNWLTAFNLLLFIAVLIIRIITDVAAARLRDELAKGVTYVNFQPLSYTLNQLRNLSAFNAVLCWIKVFRYLGVSPQMSQLTRVLSRAAKHILVFTVMFFIVYFGFAKAFFLAFSVDVKGFRSITDSIFSLFRSLLGDFDFDGLQHHNWFLGPFLFTMYIFLVFMVLFNMFLAILNDSYTKCQAEMEEEDDPFAEELQSYFAHMSRKLRKFLRMAPAKKQKPADKSSLYRLERNKAPSAIDMAAKLTNKLQVADANKDARVDVEELRNAIGGTTKAAAVLLDADVEDGDHESVAHAILSKYDKDKDGALDSEEMEQMNRELKERARDIEINNTNAYLQRQARQIMALEAKLDRTLTLLSRVARTQRRSARSGGLSDVEDSE
eukprot:TRINITY_DN33304_c0_g1_i1.p1 TRINITY_DN33304_c0_g1~~TRINITY_DN33304_c0_g1_i1.p1  ORF type:complete len:779 (+),score=407.94 TRINITY_DN33304_c0_g1_i1:183-2339(+)